MQNKQLLLGRTLRFASDPFVTAIEDAADVDTDGAVLLDGGHIRAIGDRAHLKADNPDAIVTDYGDKVIMAGFVDPHVHYPQTAMIASWGKRLIDWLNIYTFPEEMRFEDPAYAAEISARYLDLTTSYGTTTMCSFGTIHPASVDAFFAEARARGQRVIIGKTCMDRNAPEGLRDTPKSAYDDSKALLNKWHGDARLSYAITPRFSPTSTPEQLEAMGALWSEYPDCLMQTHLSEQVDEIAWVKDLYPAARDYLDTYESHNLLGPNGLYGHAIHLEEREKDRLGEIGAALIHCPTSNTFIGSGLFDMAGLKSAGQKVGLATDTGGGSSFSMLRTMAAAYEIGQLRGTPLHASQLLWLATVGSAQSLRMDDLIGNLAVGHEADLVVLDLHSVPAITQRANCAKDFWDEIFPTIMMGDDRSVAEVWIAGKRIRK